jgi:hypothetical protein
MKFSANIDCISIHTGRTQLWLDTMFYLGLALRLMDILSTTCSILYCTHCVCVIVYISKLVDTYRIYSARKAKTLIVEVAYAGGAHLILAVLTVSLVPSA